MRGRPRPSAHRPFPSMMIPQCRVLSTLKYPGIKNERLSSKSTLIFCLSALIRVHPRPKIASLLPPHRVNQRFHVVEVTPQRAPPPSRHLVVAPRPPARERFRAREIPRLFELARV